MKKLPHQLGWRTTLRWISEIPENEWISPKEYAELFHIPFLKAWRHLNKLHSWLLVDKEKRGNRTIFRINKKGLYHLEHIKNQRWCTCDKKLTCMGCLIESTVKEHYGETGYSYLLKHLIYYEQ